MAVFDTREIVSALHGLRADWRESQKRSQEPGGREFPSRDALAAIVEQLRRRPIPQCARAVHARRHGRVVESPCAHRSVDEGGAGRRIDNW